MVAGKSGARPPKKGETGKADPKAAKGSDKLRVVEGGKKDAAQAPKADAETIARGAGVNMSDENERALFFQLMKRNEAYLAAKKKADADYRNHCKLVKSEMGERGMESIKLAIKLKADGGIAELQADVRMRERVARWMGMPMGSQGDFDFTDRRPLAERAYEEGKVAGMNGDTYANPHDENSEAGKAWSQGWKDGQEAIFAIGPMKAQGDGSEVIKGSGAGKALDPIEEGGEEREAEGSGEEGEEVDEIDGGAESHPEADDDDERREIARQRAEDDAIFEGNPPPSGPAAA